MCLSFSGRWSPVALFSSGVALGVVAMATGPTLRRWGSPRPNRVFASVLPMLRANNEVCVCVCVCVVPPSFSPLFKVRDLVGSTLKPGLFRAYAYGGGLQWNGVNWSGVKLSGVDRSTRQFVTFKPCESQATWASSTYYTHSLSLPFSFPSRHSAAVVPGSWAAVKRNGQSGCQKPHPLGARPPVR